MHVKNPHLVVNNQFCTNCFHITSSTNQEGDVFARDLKGWGSKSSLGTISLSPPSWCHFIGSTFIASNPPVSLMISGMTFASRWVVTIGRLVVKSCSSLFPIKNAIFKVKLASLEVKIWKISIVKVFHDLEKPQTNHRYSRYTTFEQQFHSSHLHPKQIR